MTQTPATPLPPPKERRRLREAASLTQAQLATRVGVSRETVRAWETGRTSPRGRKREAYAKLLNDLAEDVPAVEEAEVDVAEVEEIQPESPHADIVVVEIPVPHTDPAPDP
ncbi:helix-turn-helix transcriptional regulator, partial [Streptomyces sp. MBT53]|uniref:helix-turn-helix transcriptional regulator n=1 Tax=Streptomyces sp. MBT53 TaxID=1488384 RepID=UPI0027DA9F3B